ARLAAIAVLASLSAATVSVTPAEAQFGKRLKERLKKNAEDKAIDKAVEQENEAIDAATTGNAEGDTARATAEPTEPGSSATPDASAPASTDSPSSTAAAAPADRKVWANYDFVPGQRTLFYSDFTDDQVGNFPERLEFKSGQMEVVEFEGGKRAIKASNQSEFLIPLPEVLPEKFTIELDVINRKSRSSAEATLNLAGGSDGLAGSNKDLKIGWGYWGLETRDGGLENQSLPAKQADVERYVGNPASIRLLGDGKYLKIYADEKRIANFPKVELTRGKALTVRLNAHDDADGAVYLTRIRVAESQKSIYDALTKAGRWTTQGILFDTGKSEVKPESTPTLKQIAAALKEHPELKVEIQGHTDNVGKPDANLKLSQARAEAVKAALTGEYGLNAAQLTAKGYGDTKPAADNKTAEGRANNRRVELVKS
ncbi:MAG TPA: OmpA family protein, partial [Gemmatimonadales bacterium]|nr:OmpA family protein [Gemmatimonadales bacterium]